MRDALIKKCKERRILFWYLHEDYFSPVTEIGRYLVCVFLYYPLGLVCLPSQGQSLVKRNFSHFGIDGFLTGESVRFARLTDMLLVNCIKVHLNLLSVDFLVLRHGPLYFRIFELKTLGPTLPFLTRELKPGSFQKYQWKISFPSNMNKISYVF